MTQKILQKLLEQRLLLILLAIVFFVRLLLYPFLPSEKPGRELEVDEWGIIANNIVEGYGYVYYTDPPEPSAQRGPVPVLWFAGIFFLFGYKVWPIVIGNWLLDVGTAAVLFYLARHLFPKKRGVAILTVLMFAVYVPEIIWSNLAMSESIFTLLLMLHLLTLVHLLDRPSLGQAVMAGLWLGLAALSRPIVLAFPAVVFGLMLLQYRRVWQTVKHFGMLISIFLIVLSPWVIRNYLAFGSFIPATTGSTGLGYNLLWNNYYLDSPNYRQLFDGQAFEPEIERALNAQGDSLTNYDPVSRDKLFLQMALERISQRPDRYFELWDTVFCACGLI